MSRGAPWTVLRRIVKLGQNVLDVMGDLANQLTSSALSKENDMRYRYGCFRAKRLEGSSQTLPAPTAPVPVAAPVSKITLEELQKCGADLPLWEVCEILAAKYSGNISTSYGGSQLWSMIPTRSARDVLRTLNFLSDAPHYVLQHRIFYKRSAATSGTTRPLVQITDEDFQTIMETKKFTHEGVEILDFVDRIYFYYVVGINFKEMLLALYDANTKKLPGTNAAEEAKKLVATLHEPATPATPSATTDPKKTIGSVDVDEETFASGCV